MLDLRFKKIYFYHLVKFSLIAVSKNMFNINTQELKKDLIYIHAL